MLWTEKKLARLPVIKGFRQRGERMSRTEIFSDAAFAFAVTMLVIPLTSIPGNFTELIAALKAIPAFAASFAAIMVFWMAHRKWSRRFGLDDAVSTNITLGVIFLVLVYVYPLRLMMSSLFDFISGGRLPAQFAVNDEGEMSGLVVIYGIGVCALTGAFSALYLRAWTAADQLKLNEVERIQTREDMTVWTLQSLVAFLSASFALLLYSSIGVYGGLFYLVLPIVMPLVAKHFRREARQAISRMPGSSPQTTPPLETSSTRAPAKSSLVRQCSEIETPRTPPRNG